VVTVPDWIGSAWDAAAAKQLASDVLVVAPAALLHPAVPQPAGSLVYDLLTGHPERETGELVFVADLTCELHAWPTDTWAKVGVDPSRSPRRSSDAGGTAR
jgi:hypothetical protein